MTNMIQVCSNFHRAPVFITNTRPADPGVPGVLSQKLERKGNILKYFNAFYLEVKARIWP